MSQLCKQYANALASAQPIGEFADHVAVCATCKALGATHARLFELGQGHAEADVGFSTRLQANVAATQRARTVGRVRFISVAASLALATGGVAYVVATRGPAKTSAVAAQPGLGVSAPVEPALAEAVNAPNSDDDEASANESREQILQLVRWRLAEAQWRAGRVPRHVNWREVTQPVSEFRPVLLRAAK